eukprot:TRINITY_DN24694_c0_g1_i8.p1 TRINITY_DN24694_c0_g1~~TRINITY_DN24694_c0_g1_i8.p1  ORF type:complete len:311 (+),score=35.63 TRINITY_DN24694_c0_g1_i8:43-975(+)
MQCSEALAKAFRCAVRSVCQSEPGAYNKTAHEYGLQGPNDWHPAFYGCWDWHSAVHSHFLILRCLRRYQLDEEDKERAWEALRQHLRRDKIAVEVESLQKENPGWECPYGLAWVLALAAEAAVAVRDFSARRGFGDWAKWASGMHAALVPLETAAVRRLDIWLDEIIADPQEMLNRSGLHGNSAFCLRLALEHKAVVGRQKGLPIHKLSQAVELVGKHRGDVVADGHPFLSPFLADVGLARPTFCVYLCVCRTSRYLGPPVSPPDPFKAMPNSGMLGILDIQRPTVLLTGIYRCLSRSRCSHFNSGLLER